MDREPRKIGRIEVAGVVLLCGIFAFFALSHALTTSATYDEPPHLASGYTYWKQGDYRINPEHPPLLKRLAALPLVWLDPWPDELDLNDGEPARGEGSISWNRARQSWDVALRNGDAQWVFAHALLYGVRDASLERLGAAESFRVDPSVALTRADYLNDADRLLFRARLPMILLGIVLGLLVYVWTRKLYGIRAALLALTLFSFDPSFIAHGSLVTTDVGFSLLMFGALFCLWICFTRPGAAPVAGFAACFALAFAAKHSAILLLPIVLLSGLFAPAPREGFPIGRGGASGGAGWRSRLIFLTLLVGVACSASYVAVWGSYGFRYLADARPGSTARLPVERELRIAVASAEFTERSPGVPPRGGEIEEAAPTVRLGPGERLLLFANRQGLLPEAYLQGLAWARKKSVARFAFLRGEYGFGGFRDYFVWAFLLKTPLATLVLLGLATAGVLSRRGPWGRELTFLLTPVVAYFLFSLASALNIGHRHLLPIYPFLYVFAGGMARLSDTDGKPKRWRTTALAIVAVALSSSFVFAPPWQPTAVFPNHLAFFNELAGGPRRGHLSLVDSNLDWGQDLKKLKPWLDERGIDGPINLCYFGMEDPRYRLIPHVKLPGGYELEPPFRGGATFDDAVLPGYVVISATHLQGVYFSPEQRAAWRVFLKNAELRGTVGRSLFVYYVDP